MNFRIGVGFLKFQISKVHFTISRKEPQPSDTNSEDANLPTQVLRF